MHLLIDTTITGQITDLIHVFFIPLNNFCFLKKDLFYFFGKSDIQRGKGPIFSLLIHSRSEARILEPLLGLSRRYRVSKLWAILNCFPRTQAGR